MQGSVLSELWFGVNVEQWGRRRAIAVKDNRLFFQAATCFPCPTCNNRVDYCKDALKEVQYENHTLDKLMFFSFAIPGDNDRSGEALVALLNKYFGGKLRLKLITDEESEPVLLPILKQVFSATNNDPIFEPNASLDVSEDRKTVAWTKDMQLAWVPCAVDSLFDRDFSLTFGIQSGVDEQIGVGFGLVPLDWGFYGYLGASHTAWAYDPSSGDIVCATKEFKSGLPTLPSGVGFITLSCKLTNRNQCSAQFLVNGQPTEPFPLPSNSIVQPAVCVLRKNQRVTLKNFVLQ
jgi:hypothetical protein